MCLQPNNKMYIYGSYQTCNGNECVLDGILCVDLLNYNTVTEYKVTKDYVSAGSTLCVFA